MSQYEYFLEVLEESFEKFVKSDEVNAYLQIIGPEIKTELLQYGILTEFTVISGYEEGRGNWATVYENQLRFGKKIYSINGLERSMVLTPNFFYGRNHKGEKIEYRLGLIKEETKLKVLPVLLRKVGEKIEVQVLNDLCVVHRGIAIDPESAKQLNQIEISKITSYQEFLACFWNIDDYLRKQNLAFYSDFEVDVWKAVETFSGRIVDQMLGSIINQFSCNPDWLISQAKERYITSLINWIEKCFDEGNDISENQVLVLVKNLCSFMNRFGDYEPLQQLFKMDLDLIPYLIKNMDHLESEASGEAIRAFQVALSEPELFTGHLSTIIQLLTQENVYIRNIALETVQKIFENTAEKIEQPIINEIFDLISNSYTSVHRATIELCKSVFLYTPHLLNQSQFNIIFNLLSNEDPSIRSKALEIYKIVIENLPKFIDEMGIQKIQELLLDESNNVQIAALKAYKAAFKKFHLIDCSPFMNCVLSSLEQMSFQKTEILNAYTKLVVNTPNAINEIEIKKLLILLSSPDTEIRVSVLKIIALLLQRMPEIIERSGLNKCLISSLKHGHKKVRQASLNVLKMAIRQRPDLIEPDVISELITLFSDFDKNVRKRAIKIYTILIYRTPELVTDTAIDEIYECCSDESESVRHVALVSVRLALKRIPKINNSNYLPKIRDLMFDTTEKVREAAFAAYDLAQRLALQ